jgi:hypothetical protein
MCEKNPIELAWAKIKRIVRENNVTGDLNLQKLLQVTIDSVALVTEEDWEGFCRHTEIHHPESHYWERDGILPDVIDETCQAHN